MRLSLFRKIYYLIVAVVAFVGLVLSSAFMIQKGFHSWTFNESKYLQNQQKQCEKMRDESEDSSAYQLYNDLVLTSCQERAQDRLQNVLMDKYNDMMSIGIWLFLFLVVFVAHILNLDTKD